MKKTLLLTSLLISNVTFAEYNPWNFTFLEGSLSKGNFYPNGWGGSNKDLIFEIQGFSRYKLLDLYWFVDRSNIFNDSDFSDKKDSDSNYTYGEFNPRLSIDGLINKNLSIGLISEWFISSQFDFDNVHGNKWGKNQGLRKYYLGIGNNISIPGFDYFRTNLFARYIEKNYGRNENQWDGYMFNISYGAPIYKFNENMKLAFTGWLDYDFGARNDSSKNETGDSIQWQNQLRFYFTKNLSISYTYQINHHFSQTNQCSSNRDSEAFGVHYNIIF